MITGRKKELIINSYGKSIDPLHIEALIRDAPGVEEAMLVGEGKTISMWSFMGSRRL